MKHTSTLIIVLASFLATGCLTSQTSELDGPWSTGCSTGGVSVASSPSGSQSNIVNLDLSTTQNDHFQMTIHGFEDTNCENPVGSQTYTGTYSKIDQTYAARDQLVLNFDDKVSTTLKTYRQADQFNRSIKQLKEDADSQEKSDSEKITANDTTPGTIDKAEQERIELRKKDRAITRSIEDFKVDIPQSLSSRQLEKLQLPGSNSAGSSKNFYYSYEDRTLVIERLVFESTREE